MSFCVFFLVKLLKRYNLVKMIKCIKIEVWKDDFDEKYYLKISKRYLIKDGII